LSHETGDPEIFAIAAKAQNVQSEELFKLLRTQASKEISLKDAVTIAVAPKDTEWGTIKAVKRLLDKGIYDKAKLIKAARKGDTLLFAALSGWDSPKTERARQAALNELLMEAVVDSNVRSELWNIALAKPLAPDRNLQRRARELISRIYLDDSFGNELAGLELRPNGLTRQLSHSPDFHTPSKALLIEKSALILNTLEHASKRTDLPPEARELLERILERQKQRRQGIFHGSSTQ
jgi:hypothetical protein